MNVFFVALSLASLAVVSTIGVEWKSVKDGKKSSVRNVVPDSMLKRNTTQLVAYELDGNL